MKYLIILLLLSGCVVSGQQYIGDTDNEYVTVDYAKANRTEEAIRANCSSAKSIACVRVDPMTGVFSIYAKEPRDLDDNWSNCVIGHEFFAHVIRGRSHPKGYKTVCGESYFK